MGEGQERTSDDNFDLCFALTGGRVCDGAREDRVGSLGDENKRRMCMDLMDDQMRSSPAVKRLGMRGSTGPVPTRACQQGPQGWS